MPRHIADSCRSHPRSNPPPSTTRHRDYMPRNRNRSSPRHWQAQFRYNPAPPAVKPTALLRGIPGKLATAVQTPCAAGLSTPSGPFGIVPGVYIHIGLQLLSRELRIHSSTYISDIADHKRRCIPDANPIAATERGTAGPVPILRIVEVGPGTAEHNAYQQQYKQCIINSSSYLFLHT